MIDFWDAWLYEMQINAASSWQIFTIGSLLSYGLYQYLLDRLVETKSSYFSRSFLTSITLSGSSLMIVIVSGGVLFHQYFQDIRPIVSKINLAMTLGVIQGILFLFTYLFRIEARKSLPINVVLPMGKTSILLVMLASWIFFDEFKTINGNKVVGFMLTGMAIYLFQDFEISKYEIETKHSQRNVQQRVKASLFLILTIITSAAISILSKYAVGPSKLDIYLFIFISNFVTCLISLWSLKRQRFLLNISTYKLKPVHNIFFKAMGLGILNFLGFASLLFALSLFDASVVIPMYSLYIIIPVILAAVAEGELLKPKTTVAIVLSIAALIILE